MTRPELGMAPEELLAIAGELEGCGSDLARVHATIARAMDTAAGVWRGPDVDLFRHRWDGDLSRRLLLTRTDIDELGRVLRRNVEAQIQASGHLGAPGGGAYLDGAPPATADGAGPGGGPGTGASPTPFDVLDGAKRILDARIGGTDFQIGDLLHTVPGADDLTDSMELLHTYLDPEATGADRFLGTTELGGSTVRDIGWATGGPVALLGGMAVTSFSVAGQAAQEADFSAATRAHTAAYLAEDPVRAVATVTQETAKATVEVMSKVLPFGTTIELAGKGVSSLGRLFGR